MWDEKEREEENLLAGWNFFQILNKLIFEEEYYLLVDWKMFQKKDKWEKKEEREQVD